jgi:hypothetical protein
VAAVGTLAGVATCGERGGGGLEVHMEIVLIFSWCRYKVPNIKVPNHKIPNKKVPNNKIPK